MTTIARRVRSTPVRTATETWALIVDLITSDNTAMRDDLCVVGDLAAMLISEEHACEHPILLTGCGPQIRIYTLHGTAAIDGALANESPLTVTASPGWQLSIPAHGADLRLAATHLANANHVVAYDPTTNDTEATTWGLAAPPTTTPRRVTVDLSALES